MTDSQDKSDDLIAELAKLMANGASSGEAAPKPAVIKLPPLSEATVRATPVRIPGMEPPSGASPQPAPAPTERPASTPSSAGAVRIPGMDRQPASGDSMPTAPAPRPGSQFDFGRPPSAAPIKAEPMGNWQARDVPPPPPAAPVAPKPSPSALPAPGGNQHAEGQSVGGVKPQAPATSLNLDPIKLPPVTPHPVPSRPKTATAAPQPVAVDKATSDSADSFDFDFGFTPDESSDSSTGKEAHDDPIADLIAAELLDSDGAGDSDDDDDADQEEAPQAASRSQPAPVVAAARSSTAPGHPTANDQFSAAPSFAAPQRPDPVAPTFAAKPVPHAADHDDPMHEIENLIGEAVRVDLDPPERTHGQPTAPVVPPLGTGFAPRRAGLRDREPSVESAEAAILSASDDGHLDAPEPDDRPYKRMKVKPPRTSGIPAGMRQYVGIAVAGTLLLASGFGLYWVLGMGRDDPSNAPVLTADSSPAKVEPDVQPTAAEATSGSVVFDEIDGVIASAENEALVSRDETAGATVTEVARVTTPTASSDTGGSDVGLANRKVRTVTVRPDGTIVASDDTVAGATELPVDRPNVPEIPGATTRSDLLAAVADPPTTAAQQASDAVAGAGEDFSALVAETIDEANGQLSGTDPIEVAALNGNTNETPAVFDGSMVAPVPMPRPSSRANMVGARTASLATAPATTGAGANQPASTPLTAITQQPQQTAPAATASRAGAYVQLSSQRTEADASSSLRSVQSRWGSMLTAPLEIRRVDLGARGIWYRVVMPTNSFQDATQGCARIKASGGDCVAING